MRAVFLLFVLFILALVCAAARGEEDAPQPVQARVACKDGKPVAVQILAPAAGVVTIYLPPDVCEQDEEPERQPAREA